MARCCRLACEGRRRLAPRAAPRRSRGGVGYHQALLAGDARPLHAQRRALRAWAGGLDRVQPHAPRAPAVGRLPGGGVEAGGGVHEHARLCEGGCGAGVRSDAHALRQAARHASPPLPPRAAPLTRAHSGDARLAHVKRTAGGQCGARGA